MRHLLRLALALSAAATFVITTGVAASSNVATSHAESRWAPQAANNVKPSVCAALNLAVVVNGAGDPLSTTNELLLAGPGTATVTGGHGSDCIFASPGVSSIDGGAGPSLNVCIGGTATVYKRCDTIIKR